MLQCEQCEFFSRGPRGEPALLCDPFSTIKEPECLAKWNLVHMRRLAQAHEATLEYYRRLAPMQERMFKHVERELDAMDEGESWKQQADDDEFLDEDDEERRGRR